MEADFRKILLRLRLRKTKGSIVRLTLRAHEELVRMGYTDAEVVTGYAIWGTHGCWHIWIECGAMQLDVGQTLVKIPVTLVREPPPGTNIMGDFKEYLEEYRHWRENPKDYFKTIPNRPSE